jgi:hypothetical protein
MRASHLRKWDLTVFYDGWRQTVVFRTGTTEYATEYCRGLKGVGETPADCVRTGEPTAYRAPRRGWDRTSDLPRVKLRLSQEGVVCAGHAGRTGPILKVTSTQSKRRGGYGADENESVIHGSQADPVRDTGHRTPAAAMRPHDSPSLVEAPLARLQAEPRQPPRLNGFTVRVMVSQGVACCGSDVR